MKALRLAALSIVVLAGGVQGGDRVRIDNVKTEWQNAYGAIIYTVLADVTNVSSTPVEYVKVRVELLDKDGKLVAERLGYNAGAEVLDVVVDGSDAETPGERLKAVKPIAPGRSDLIRISLDKADIGKPFRKTNVTLIEVR